MTEYLTEEEQLQHLKQLARQYIPAVLVGLLLAFALTSGWRAYQNHQNQIRIDASLQYETLLAADRAGHLADANKQATTLLEQYPKTAYANLAALFLARQAVTQGNLNEAENALNTVIQRGKKTGVYTIARLRLARLKIAANDPAAALTLLDNTDDPAFQGLIDAIRGDALAAQHKPEAAALAFRQALKELPDTGMIPSLLQMKYNNLRDSTVGNDT